MELLKASPHNPALALSQIEQATGKQISRSTLKRLAKGASLATNDDEDKDDIEVTFVGEAREPMTIHLT